MNHYRVHRANHGWEVTRDESLVGLFSSFNRAVRYANRRARQDVHDDIVARILSVTTATNDDWAW